MEEGIVLSSFGKKYRFVESPVTVGDIEGIGIPRQYPEVAIEIGN